MPPRAATLTTESSPAKHRIISTQELVRRSTPVAYEIYHRKTVVELALLLLTVTGVNRRAGPDVHQRVDRI